MAQRGRFTYFWQVDGEQSREMVRIAFLMLQCFETALPLGGEIQIGQEGDD
jgi:histidine phosphotransferase ChpT